MSVSRRAMLPAAMVLGISACTVSPPPIARGLPSEMSAARTTFDQRIKDRFPIGSAQADMLTELHLQGFNVDTPTEHSLAGYQYSSTRRAAALVCKVSWIVWWSAEYQKITAVEGDYGQVCL